ncbi:MAG: DUF3500 domain-containing protein [Pirellula sp.]
MHSNPFHRPVDRRWFLKSSAGSVGATALSASALSALADKQFETIEKAPETLVKLLYQSLSDKQKEAICFDWDYMDPKRGLLRTRVANNWKITNPTINSDFYTAEQRALVKSIFEGIIHPDWHAKMYKQLQDDMGGFGKAQSAAIFGTPGGEKFEFVLTGRHTTLRCDGNSAEHVALGGPIFYGHQAGKEDMEKPDHPGNVFWEQALSANSLYKTLDAKQLKLAEISETPPEDSVAFRGKTGEIPGLPVSEMTRDQKQVVVDTLAMLVAPFRTSDRDEVQKCIASQGGVDSLRLSFFTDDDIGNDKVWDNWRLEGPSFVWHFRGSPHVHVWVNIADNSSVKLNA